MNVGFNIVLLEEIIDRLDITGGIAAGGSTDLLVIEYSIRSFAVSVNLQNIVMQQNQIQ